MTRNSNSMLARSYVLAALFWSAMAHAQNQPAAANGSLPAAAPASEVWLSFGLDRIPWLAARPFAGIPLWQLLASFIYIFLAFYAAKLLDFFIRERVQKWAEKTETKWDDLLVNLVRGPVKVITFVIFSQASHSGLKSGQNPSIPSGTEGWFSKRR